MLLELPFPRPAQTPKKIRSRARLGRSPPRPAQKVKKAKRTVAAAPPDIAPTSRPQRAAFPRPPGGKEAAHTEPPLEDDSLNHPRADGHRSRALPPLTIALLKRGFQHASCRAKLQRRHSTAAYNDDSDDDEMQEMDFSDRASIGEPILRAPQLTSKGHHVDDPKAPAARRYRIPKQRPLTLPGCDDPDEYEMRDEDSRGDLLIEEDREPDIGAPLDHTPRKGRARKAATQLRQSLRYRAVDGSDGVSILPEAHNADFAGLMPKEHASKSAEAKLQLIANILGADSIDVAGMLAAAAGSTRERNDECGNASVKLRARQAARDLHHHEGVPSPRRARFV